MSDDHYMDGKPTSIPRSEASAVLADVRRALSRHKKKAFLLFLLVAGAATAAAFLLPRTYRSEGLLLVRLGRENVTVDATATLGREPVVAVPASRENEINSLVEVLRSRALVEKVVDALGPDAILGSHEQTASEEFAREPGPGEESTASVVLAGGMAFTSDRGHAIGRREQAVLRLAPRIGIAPARRSNVIAISCEGPSPQWAQAVVAKLMDIYLVDHIRLNRPQGSLEFFAQQAERLHGEQVRKEEQFRDLKSSTGIASVADQRKTMADRVGRLQDDLASAETARAVSAAKVGQLREQLSGVPEKQVTSQTVGHPDQGYDLMRQQLYLLQVKREEAASKYTPAHPTMQEIEEQYAAAKQEVERHEPTRTQITTANNRLHEESRLALMQEEAAMASSLAKTKTIQEQLVAAGRDLRVFNEHELQIAQLEQEVELARANYRTYAASVERARIDQALEAQRISNLSVVQEATYEPRSVRPRKAFVLGFGLMAGLLSGFGLALAAEWTDRRFHAPEDVERRLDLPVLGSVPHARSRDLAMNGAVGQ